jgi:hypothetical protein
MKEEDIRPEIIFDEFLRLAKIDIDIYFKNVTEVSINCPCCGTISSFAFEKYGFNYDKCNKCHSLYVNPRPTADAFSNYYSYSNSAKYWATTFYKETASARVNKLWKPKSIEINELIKQYKPKSNPILVDIGGGFGLFANEIRKLISGEVIIIEPGSDLASICRENNFLVVEKFLENVIKQDLPNGEKVFVSFELFEHLTDPVHFLNCLFSIMSSGDLFIFTTLSSLGIDIQLLGKNSKSVSPPHHLNFFNPISIKKLLNNSGFETLQVTTPGKLDMDILHKNKNHINDNFWKTFFEITSEIERVKWQEWISEQGLSSHMCVVCQKP